MAARGSAERVISDSRVRHFYDPERRVGEAIAHSLGGREGEVAWDIYLFYEAGNEWAKGPPAPSAWMHQLVDSQWASMAHYRTGDALVAALRETTSKLAAAVSL